MFTDADGTVHKRNAAYVSSDYRSYYSGPRPAGP